MTNLEIQRGKDEMPKLPFHRRFGATAACSIRLACSSNQSFVDGSTEVVKGNSWFGSMKTVCGVGDCVPSTNN